MNIIGNEVLSDNLLMFKFIVTLGLYNMPFCYLCGCNVLVPKTLAYTYFDNLFQNMTHMKFVCRDLSHNDIQKIAGDSMRNLPWLQEL